jgi:hypothetical protein
VPTVACNVALVVGQIVVSGEVICNWAFAAIPENIAMINIKQTG